MDRRVMGDELVRLLPRLRRFALALARSPEDADDLLQAALERGLRHSEQLTSDERLESWMFRIVRSVWSNMRRSAGLRRAEPLDGNEDAASIDGERAAEASVELRLVRRAFDDLPAEQRATLVLVCLEGYGYAEAADILGVPLGTVTSRLVRGRTALLEAMSDPPGRNVTILHRRTTK